MDNSNFINLMKRQQEMIQNQQAQISQLLEMQQRQSMENEQKEYVKDTNPTYEREVQYEDKNDKPNLKIDPYKILNLPTNSLKLIKVLKSKFILNKCLNEIEMIKKELNNYE